MRDALQRLVGSWGCRSRPSRRAREFLQRRGADDPGCLVLDVRYRDWSGLDSRASWPRRRSTPQSSSITGYGDIPMTVRAHEGRSGEFPTKPFAISELLDAIQQALERDAWHASSGRRRRLRRPF